MQRHQTNLVCETMASNHEELLASCLWHEDDTIEIDSSAPSVMEIESSAGSADDANGDDVELVGTCFNYGSFIRELEDLHTLGCPTVMILLLLNMFRSVQVSWQAPLSFVLCAYRI